MIKPRIIPCLLLDDQDLVKTIKFSKKKYIGDPLNTIRIFNELETLLITAKAEREGGIQIALFNILQGGTNVF